MMKLKYLTSCILLLFVSNIIGQKQHWVIVDTLHYDVNEVYIDQLNQIYLLQKGKQNILKLNENLSTNQEYLSPFISQYCFMDVKDPMKLLVFLPQFSNVNFLDESLAPLSEEYFANFNNESAICYYSSHQICYFADGKINIRNLENQQIQSSERISYDRNNVNEVSQLKSNGQEVFLLLPGYGLWKFNSFLNTELFIEDSQIKRIELIDHQLYVLKENKISLLKNSELQDEIIMDLKSDNVISFAMNNKYLLVAINGAVLRKVKKL